MTTLPATRQRVSARVWNERLLFTALVAPNLLLLALFTFWPMVYNVYLSGVQWGFMGPMRWVGLDNYVNLLSDDLMLKVLGNTLVFTVACVALTMGLGLGLAVLLNQPLRWRNSARAVLFMPTVLSGAAIAIVWIYIFDPRFGLLQEILAWFRIEQSPPWLSSPAWAMPAIIIVYVWKNLGYAVVIYLAGLQAIDRTLYEAAEIDGAGGWAKFRNVTLPGLSPILFFLVVTSVLSCFQAFDIVRVMTQGGPVNATNTLVYYLYELGFERTQAGPAGVVAVVMFLVMMALTVLQLRFVERRVHYS